MKNLSLLVLLLISMRAGAQGVFANNTNSAIEKAVAGIVSKRESSKKEETRWRTEVLETSSFEAAASKYKELYNQIGNSVIRIEGQKPYILNGQYEAPSETRRNHSIIFSMLPAIGQMQNVKVELQLIQQASTWRVSMAVYE
jgi:hypothetical protein